MKKTLLIIPVFNEEKAIVEVLESLLVFHELDILVVDDASTDSSADKVWQFERVQLLPLQINLGAWGAIQTGMRFALRKGYSRVITMDGDGQHHTGEIPHLIEAKKLYPETDVVIGMCTERGSSLRKWAWRYFRRLTGIRIEDITSGFRLYNRAAMKLLADKRGTLLDYQDVGILLLLQEAGLTITEVKVKMSPRAAGRSHIYYNWFAVAYYMMLTTVLSLAKGRPLRINKIRR